MMAELLALVYVGDMYLYHRALQTADAVLQGDAGVGVGSGVEHHAIVAEAYFLKLVDELALDVALIILYLDVGVFGFQLRQIALERIAAINTRLSYAQEVQVWTIDDLYLHNRMIFVCESIIFRIFVGEER